MTVLEAMREEALAKFDELVAENQQSFRLALRAGGRSEAEIDHMIDLTRPALAAQRSLVAANVAIALLKTGAPLNDEAAGLWP